MAFLLWNWIYCIFLSFFHSVCVCSVLVSNRNACSAFAGSCRPGRAWLAQLLLLNTTLLFVFVLILALFLIGCPRPKA